MGGDGPSSGGYANAMFCREGAGNVIKGIRLSRAGLTQLGRQAGKKVCLVQQKADMPLAQVYF
jgi:hypothetical protein